MRGELSDKATQNLPINNTYASTHQSPGAEILNILIVIYGNTTIYTNYISQQLHFEQVGKTINRFTYFERYYFTLKANI